MDVTIFDIVNNVMGYKLSAYRKSEREIKNEEGKLKNLQKFNSTVYRQRSKLKKELSKGVPRWRVFEIEEKLNQLKTLPLEHQRNYIRMVKGEDFKIIVDNGFNTKSYWRSDIVSNPDYHIKKFLLDMVKDIKDAMVDQKAQFNAMVGTSTKQELARRERIIHSMRKLLSKVYTNIDVLETGDETKFEGDYEDGESDKMADESNFPIGAEFIGETIRVNF